MIIPMEEGLQMIPPLQRLMIVGEVALMAECWAIGPQRASVDDLRVLLRQEEDDFIA